MENSSHIELLLAKYKDVFKEEIGAMKGEEANMETKPQSTPKFFHPRLVPFALKDATERELDRLENEGILQKVKSC